MKVAYCGYDFFADCFESLAENRNIEVMKLYTFKTDDVYNFNKKILDIANKYNIPFTLEKISGNDVEELAKMGCECIIAAAYPYKIPIKQNRGINIHPTLLPIGRGPWPLPRVILSEQEKSGVTIHKLTDELDSGDVLIQKSFVLNEKEDLETLSCRSQMLAQNLIETIFQDQESFEYYWKNAYPQGEGEYWSYPSDLEMTFNGNMTVDEIDKIVRAYGKFDSCVEFEGRTWLVWDVNVWKEEHTYEPGTIVHKTNKEYLMAAKDGFVCLRFFKEDV